MRTMIFRSIGSSTEIVPHIRPNFFWQISVHPEEGVLQTKYQAYLWFSEAEQRKH